MGKRKKARPNKPSEATAKPPRIEPPPSSPRRESEPISASEAELLSQALDAIRTATAEGKSGSVRFIPDTEVATPRPAPGRQREHEQDVDTGGSGSKLLRFLRTKEGVTLLTAMVGLGTAGVSAHTAAVQAKQAQTPVAQTRTAEPRSPGQSQPPAGSGDPTQMSDAQRLALFGRFVGESLSSDRSQIARFQAALARNVRLETAYPELKDAFPVPADGLPAAYDPAKITPETITVTSGPPHWVASVQVDGAVLLENLIQRLNTEASEEAEAPE